MLKLCTASWVRLSLGFHICTVKLLLGGYKLMKFGFKFTENKLVRAVGFRFCVLITAFPLVILASMHPKILLLFHYFLKLYMTELDLSLQAQFSRQKLAGTCIGRNMSFTGPSAGAS